jgi:Uma2 family endonuclease
MWVATSAPWRVGSRAHAYLAIAIGSELRLALRNQGFFYADATVTCGRALTAGENDVALNPTLIVEVLSKSTESFDRGDKFAYYRRIESLCEYVPVSQTEPRVEVFLRQPGRQMDDDGVRGHGRCLPLCAYRLRHSVGRHLRRH